MAHMAHMAVPHQAHMLVAGQPRATVASVTRATIRNARCTTPNLACRWSDHKLVFAIIRCSWTQCRWKCRAVLQTQVSVTDEVDKAAHAAHSAKHSVRGRNLTANAIKTLL